MAFFGSVAFNVKRLLRDGQPRTIGEIARATGDRYDSVETVIRRLLEDGFVEHMENVTSGQRGRPAASYTLTTDPDLRKIVLEEISDRKFTALVPTSPHYQEARDILDEMLIQGPDNPKSDKQPLRDAQELLEIAWFEEGKEHASDPVRATLELEGLRLEYLRGKPVKEEDLEALRQVFYEHELWEMTGALDEFYVYVMAARRYEQMEPGEEKSWAWIESLLDVLNETGYQPSSLLAATWQTVMTRVLEQHRAEARLKPYRQKIKDWMQMLPGSIAWKKPIALLQASVENWMPFIQPSQPSSSLTTEYENPAPAYDIDIERIDVGIRQRSTIARVYLMEENEQCFDKFYVVESSPSITFETSQFVPSVERK